MFSMKLPGTDSWFFSYDSGLMIESTGTVGRYDAAGIPRLELNATQWNRHVTVNEKVRADLGLAVDRVPKA